MTKKVTFKRQVVLKGNCPTDWGLGKGVIHTDEITYEIPVELNTNFFDKEGNFNKNADQRLFFQMQQDADNLIKDHITVEVEAIDIIF